MSNPFSRMNNVRSVEDAASNDSKVKRAFAIDVGTVPTFTIGTMTERGLRIGDVAARSGVSRDRCGTTSGWESSPRHRERQRATGDTRGRCEHTFDSFKRTPLWVFTAANRPLSRRAGLRPRALPRGSRRRRATRGRHGPTDRRNARGADSHPGDAAGLGPSAGDDARGTPSGPARDADSAVAFRRRANPIAAE